MSDETGVPSDEELVAAVLAGDEELFGEIVGRYEQWLVSFLYRMLRNLDDAHDLAQEVFLKVYQALDRYDPSYKLSTWIFRIGRNAAIDRIRRKRLRTVSISTGFATDPDEERELELASPDRGPHADLRNRERGAAIQRAIDALPPDYRELILLRHFGELSYEEIAEEKEMPLGTVKNKLFRARQILKEHLGGELEE